MRLAVTFCPRWQDAAPGRRRSDGLVACECPDPWRNLWIVRVNGSYIHILRWVCPIQTARHLNLVGKAPTDLEHCADLSRVFATWWHISCTCPPHGLFQSSRFSTDTKPISGGDFRLPCVSIVATAHNSEASQLQFDSDLRQNNLLLLTIPTKSLPVWSLSIVWAVRTAQMPYELGSLILL